MTFHEVFYTAPGGVIMMVCLTLLTLQMALLFASSHDRRSPLVRSLHLLLSMVIFISFFLPMLDYCWVDIYPDGSPSALLLAFEALPPYVMISFEVLMAVVIFAEYRDLLRYKREHPSFESIKETMDLLPAGLAFAKPCGTVVFSNLAMNELSFTLTGNRLNDLESFRSTLSGSEGSGIDSSQHNEVQVASPDGSATWQLQEELLEMEGKPYTQLTATDITEQASITRELERNNKRLRDIHMRLDIYNKQAARIIIAQELLTARVAVHNEVGQVLLESRHYLNEPSSFNEEKLLQALKNTNTYLLKEYEEDDTLRDPLADALEMADAIGVDADITGIIPADDPYRTILAAAISECAANTVKHANGDQLSVDISKTGTDIVYILKNNGEQPTEAIRESGGLLSLRSIVEQEGGMMHTEISPEYRLTIRLPERR